VRNHSRHQLRHNVICILALCTGPGYLQSSDPEYEFVKDTKRWVGIVRGDKQLLGYLDDAGNFTPNAQYQRGQPLFSAPVHSRLNWPGSVGKKVYEFRSGALIRGELTEDGDFVPEIGAKVIAFSDYKFSPAERPIWNLPGYFRLRAGQTLNQKKASNEKK
jgi:hypothetical protein